MGKTNGPQAADWPGRTPDVHLNEKGRAQAEHWPSFWLQASRSAAIYSSPLERCLETAQPLADVLGLPVARSRGD